MRVHIYKTPTQPIGPKFGAPNWIGYTCTCCGHISGLDAWQLHDLPPSIAKCPQGRSLRWWERLNLWLFHGTLDCLAK